MGQDPTKEGALPHLAPVYSECKKVVSIVPTIEEQAAVDSPDTKHSVNKAQSEKPLFIDAHGNALRCSRCKYARTKYIPEEQREPVKQGQPLTWHGLCLLDRDGLLNIVGMHTRCALFADVDCISVMQ